MRKFYIRTIRGTNIWRMIIKRGENGTIWLNMGEKHISSYQEGKFESCIDSWIGSEDQIKLLSRKTSK